MEDRDIKEQLFGFLALPSNKKVKSFFQNNRFTSYVSQIIANEETWKNETPISETKLKLFRPEKGKGINAEIGLQLISVFSIASVGINLPQHFFLQLSFDNFKPNFTRFSSTLKINERYISPEPKVFVVLYKLLAV